jgi:hypothetical protein
MYYIRLFFLIVCISFTSLGCKKDSVNNNCEDLKNAMVTDAKDNIKSLINSFISRLPSQAYTEQNINALASSLSNECSISALVVCFDCIATLPTESEIYLTVTSNQSNISTAVDISYTPDNKMKCVGVHN